MSRSFVKNAAYTFLGLVTFGKGIPRKINGMKVRFPPKWFRYFPGDYESDNYAFLKENIKEGMQVIDIGAHIGLFSVCTSQLTGPTGKIICFEPTPDTFSILKETLRINHCDNVIAQQAAVGVAPGKATFYISNELEGCNSNSLVLHKDKKQIEGYDVTITSIDALCSEYSLKPDLIKIDVEGAELDVLKGGINTLKTGRPLIILGLHPAFIAAKGDSLNEIWDLLKECRYQVIYDGSEITETDFIIQHALFDVRCLPV